MDAGYNTVELPINDPPRRDHNRNNLSTLQSPKYSFSHIFNTF